MIANGGVLGGERYLSEAGVAQMTTRQTDPAWAEGYGLGWGTGDGWFGHGGALATNMEIEPGRGLITIRLLQGLAAGEAGAELFTAIKERLQTAFSG
jgi:CubicO group peptidase (beta-lactamase class C family)